MRFLEVERKYHMDLEWHSVSDVQFVFGQAVEFVFCRLLHWGVSFLDKGSMEIERVV